MKRMAMAVVGIVAAALLAGCGDDDGGGGSGCPTTSNPPDVSGDWLLGVPAISSSTCDEEIDEAVLDILGFTTACEYEVMQDGNSVHLTNCNTASDGVMFDGCVDDAGVITFGLSESETVDGCTLDFDVGTALDSVAPTSARVTLDFGFSGNCDGLQSCRIVLTGPWEPLSGTAPAPPAGAAASEPTLPAPLSAIERGLRQLSGTR